MAHQVSIRANGQAEMAYVGQLPWHGLGQQLTAGASIEEWTTQAGLDWTVKKSRVRYATDREATELRVIDDRIVLFRSDSLDPVGVVSDRYQVVQPAEVLEFFRDLTQGAGFELNTAGSLFGGKVVWAQANIGAEAYVADPKDKVAGKLLLLTSMDGSKATEAKFVSTRVVCNNTLTMAGMESGTTKVRTKHNTTFDPASVKDQLGVVAKGAWQQFIDSARELAATPIDLSDANRLTTALFVPSKLRDAVLTGTAADKATVEALAKATGDARDTRGFKQVMDLFNGQAKGSGMDGVKETAWGWLNAVTEYVDHGKRANSPDNRFASSLTGPGEIMKLDALDMALRQRAQSRELVRVR